ncbi:Urocanate hydratase [compost metagenome]
MTSSGVTTIADGSDPAAQRLQLSMTNDTTTGVMRYADAGYQESLDEIADKSLPYISLPRGE